MLDLSTSELISKHRFLTTSQVSLKGDTIDPIATCHGTIVNIQQQNSDEYDPPPQTVARADESPLPSLISTPAALVFSLLSTVPPPPVTSPSPTSPLPPSLLYPSSAHPPASLPHSFNLPALRAHFIKSPTPESAIALIDLEPGVLLDTEEEINVIAASLYVLCVRYDELGEKERVRGREELRKVGPYMPRIGTLLDSGFMRRHRRHARDSMLGDEKKGCELIGCGDSGYSRIGAT